jgi:hypothetical protein
VRTTTVVAGSVTAIFALGTVVYAYRRPPETRSTVLIDETGVS